MSPLGTIRGGFVQGTPAAHLPTAIVDKTTFESAVFLGKPNSGVTLAHMRAYAAAYAGVSFGTEAPPRAALYAKSWVIDEYRPRDWVSTYGDIAAFLRVRGRTYANLGVAIQIWVHGQADISATLNPFHLSDLTAALAATPPVDFPAELQTIPPANLPSELQPVPGANLGAIGGGHFPEDLVSYLNSVPPVDFLARIRGGWSGTLDLGASLTQTGGFVGVGAYINTWYGGSPRDISARIIVKIPHSIGATIRGWVELDLGASLITQRVRDIRAIIAGYARGVTRDIGAVIRRADAGVTDLSVVPFKARVSTHTSDKLPNLTLVSRPFFQNVYAFGSRAGGLTIMALEPVFGVFPDLHAEIFARDFSRVSFPAYLRVAQASLSNIGSSTEAVSPYININRVLLSLIPLLNLPGDLVQVGGFLRLRGSVRPVHRESTGTAEDSGFVTTATTYRFYLGTTLGLFAPPQVPARVRLETFTNNHPRPDLHAIISGWYQTDLGAAISDYPFKALPASIGVYDISHLSALPASLFPAHPFDLGASLAPAGAYRGLSASIGVAGAISDLGAYLNPYVTPLAYNVVTVSTKPFRDLGALINYGDLVTCASMSAARSLPAHIRPVFPAGLGVWGDLGAELNALRVVLDFGAEIIARKRTRVRVLCLDFRSKLRASAGIRGSVIPVIPMWSDLSAEIMGMSHESDLSASLTPQRYPLPEIDFQNYEHFVDLFDPSVEKYVLVSFRSQVSSYVFDSVASMVYPTDRGSWAIDLRTAETQASFFDLSENNRISMLSEIGGYHSLDEALRMAMSLLCERRQESLSALLTARGAIRNLGVSIGIVSADRTNNLSASAVAVSNSPDISASINLGRQSSRFSGLRGAVVPARSVVPEDLGGDITGNIVEDLSAEITAL